MSFTKKTVKDVNVEGKIVLLRTDYNVPLNEHGKILDDYRIKQSLDTIEYLQKQSAKIVIISHLGRPEGKVVPKLSLAPVAKQLEKLTKNTVHFSDITTGGDVNYRISQLKAKDILVLENLRFDPREEKNSTEMAKQLAESCDLFVQDGFAVVHRKHVSTHAITKQLPSVSGLLLQNEVETIKNGMNNPERPLMAIIGGAKISDKIELVEQFIKVADFVAIGGAMANTFLKAEGFDVAKSLYEPNSISDAKRIIEMARDKEKMENFTFFTPTDGVVTKKIDSNTTTRVVDWGSHTSAEINNYPKNPPKESHSLEKDEMIVDIGPASSHYIAGALHAVQTVLWNGTMGIAEIPGLMGTSAPFEHGTRVIYENLTSVPGNKPYSIIGGGETAAYVMGQQGQHLAHEIDHVSTGGGASLELMAGKKLPGVEALANKK